MISQEENSTVKGIKMWQHLMQTIHPVVEKELIKLSLVLFLDARSCRIEVDLPTMVNVHLKPYSGFKKIYHKYVKRYNKKHMESAKQLAQYISYWMPSDKTGIKPKIQIFWE